MARKVLIDCDPGIDDSVALCMALFDPRLEVVGLTAVEGNASAAQTSRNVQTFIDQVDPPRYPRIGVAEPASNPPLHEFGSFHGKDGLGNCNFEVSMLHHKHPSEKVICDIVRSDPHNVTILALGPLTNVARAFQRDPDVARLVRDIVMMGGCVGGIGNVSACAEFNMFYDPASAQTVFDSPTTKTLVPLDVTRQIIYSLDLMDQLPGEESRVGRFLRKILPHSFSSHRHELGLEGIYIHDVMALLMVLNPELFTTEEMHGAVEKSGELTRGYTVFDRRDFPQQRPNMDVAVACDTSEARRAVLRGLKYAGQQSVDN